MFIYSRRTFFFWGGKNREKIRKLLWLALGFWWYIPTGVLLTKGSKGGFRVMLWRPKIRGKADPSEEELHPRSRWRLGSSSLAKSRKDVPWSCNGYSFPNLKTCICIPYIYIYIMVYINKGEASPKMIFFPFFSGGLTRFKCDIFLNSYGLTSYDMTWVLSDFSLILPSWWSNQRGRLASTRPWDDDDVFFR